MAQALHGTAIACAVQDTDRYGRSVAICYAGGTDLGQAQVAAGAARAYLRYSDRYAATEATAAAGRRGIWAARMQTPERFRHAVPPGNAASNCPIKGNIGAQGRIYHLPGQRDYAATRISLAKGEGFFCSEAAATAAGFRPARR